MFRLVFFLLCVVSFRCVQAIDLLIRHAMSFEKWEEEDWPNEPYHDFLQRVMKYQTELQPFKKHRISWTIVKRCLAESSWVKDSILEGDRITWNNLQLFGSYEEEGRSLLSQVDRTKTALSHKMLSCWIAFPKKKREIGAVQNRQKIVRSLVDDEDLFQSLDHHFSSMQGLENFVLSFWLNDPLYNAASKKYFQYFQGLNYSSWALEAGCLWDHTKRATLFVTSGYGCYRLGGLSLGWHEAGAASYLGAGGSIFPFINETLGDWFRGALAKRTLYSLATLGSMKGFAEAFEWEKDQIELETCLTKKLHHLADYLEHMRFICDLIKDKGWNTEFSLSDRLEKLTQNDNPICELLHILKRISKGTLWFLSLGDVLKAYKILQDHRSELEYALCAVAEIDAYMSVARLYKEFEHLPVTYCFPTFVENEVAPMLVTIESWNPFISPEKAVSNSIDLGRGDEVRNMILTGPNEGGKSTFVRGVILKIIEAQGIGLLSARNAWLTPFDYVATYLNVTDRDGKSLFDAQVERSKLLIDRIDDLDSDQFACVILDELYNGTNPETGQRLAYNYAKNLGLRPNVVAILPTHFPLLTTLNAADGYTKYSVTAEISNNGEVRYLYKIVPGVWTRNIAIDIMRKAGFSDEFLQEPIPN